MCNKLFVPEEEKLTLFRKYLVNRQLQEKKDYLIAQIRSSQKQHEQHKREMAQINMLFNPLGWAVAIRRYARQLAETASVNKSTRTLMKQRHQQDIVTLDTLIKRQKLYLKNSQQSDMLFIDRFNEVFDWSFSETETYYYRQALHGGYSLVLTDMDESIVWVSQAFETMTGYKSTEVTGRNVRFLQGDRTDPATRQHLRRHLDHALEVEADLVNYRKKGEAYLCHIHIKPLRNRGGEPTHFMAIENEVDTHQ